MTLRGGFRRNSNILSYHDQSKMTQAILKKLVEVVQSLLKNNSVDVNETDTERRSYLHLACFVGCKEIVELLIKAGANVNIRDCLGLTPMHRCCRNNQDEVMRVLIQCPDLDVNCKSKDGTTPLHVCAANNAFECAELFIPKVSSIDARDDYGASPLHHAAFNGHNDLIGLLIKHGADVNAEDPQGRTPLHFAAFMDDPTAIEFLASAGANLDAADIKMMTPLHLAAAKGHQLAVVALIQCSARVNEIDEWGNTPLHWAAFFGHEEVIDELIMKGGSLVNAPNLVGLTPLHFAVISKHGRPVVNTLIRQKNTIGLDLDAKDIYGRTALHWANMYSKKSIMELIGTSSEEEPYRS